MHVKWIAHMHVKKCRGKGSYTHGKDCHGLEGLLAVEG